MTMSLIILQLTGFLLLNSNFISCANEEISLQSYLSSISNSIYARPVKNSAHPVKVNVTFFLEQIPKVTPYRVTLCGTLFAYWSDERMKWNATAYAGLQMTRYSIASLWTPNFFFTNGAGNVQDIVGDTQNDQVSLLSTGVVYYQKRNCLEAICSMNMRRFPDDEHTCQVLLGVLGYQRSEVELVAETSFNSLATYVNSSEWNLMKWATEATTIVLPIVGSSSNRKVKVPQYVFNVTINRRPTYFSTTITYPVVLLSLIALLCFFIPVESGEKIGLAVTILLAFSFYLLLMDVFLSKGPNQPWLNVYLLVMLGISATTMYASAVVLRIYHIDPQHGRPTQWMFNLFIKRLGLLVAHFGCCRNRKAPKRRKEVEGRDEDAEKDIYKKKKKNDKKEKKHEKLTMQKLGAVEPVKSEEVEHEPESEPKPEPKPEPEPDLEEKTEAEVAVRRRKPKRKPLRWKVVEPEEEWRLMASILDKTLMLIGLLVVIILIIVLLGTQTYSS